MHTLSLQDLVSAALSQAGSLGKEKLAEDANGVCERCGKPAMAGSKICKDCAERSVAKQDASQNNMGSEGAEKTSSARIEKLAGAIDHIVKNFNDINFPVGAVKSAAALTDGLSNTGPGRGPNTIPTNLDSVPTGEQAQVVDPAKKSTIEKVPSMTQGAPNAPKNAVGDNEKASFKDYPKDGVLKTAARERMRIALRKLAATAQSSGKLTLPEDQPSKMVIPAETARQAQMVASNEAAMNVKKTEAKAVPKKHMGELLEEKPQDIKSSLEPALGSEVVKHAHQQKVAAGRAILTKIASEGCKCGPQKGECSFCKVASRLKKTQGMKKKSQMGGAAVNQMGQTPAGASNIPPTVQTSSTGSIGSGTNSM